MTIDVYRPTLAMLKDDAPLNEAEEELIAGCKIGEMVRLPGDGVPDKATAQNTIRAGLIRYLLLGGCADARPHPKGVQLQGAWISDVLDLEGCKTPLQLGVVNSRFDQAPVLKDCELGLLWLDGSHLPGLNADRMRVMRNVMLGNGFSSAGPVDLNGSVISGQLACTGGRFDGAGGAALKGHRLEVGGGVFLSGDFSAAGLVDLTGSVIRGQLACTGGSFDGAGGAALKGHGLEVGGDVFLRAGFSAGGLVDLTGSVIKGQLDCTDGRFDGVGGAALMGHRLEVGASVFLSDGFSAAGLVDLNGSVITGQLDCTGGSFDGDLRLQGVQVTGPFFWRDMRGKIGWLDLTDASVGQLVDDAPSWQRVGRYDIDGFQYGALSGALDVAARLDWLGRAYNPTIAARKGPWRVPGGEPDVESQPYTQLAHELDRVGQRRGAAEVRLAREYRIRRSAYYKGRAPVLPWLARFWLMLWGDARHGFNIFYGLVFGYGHAPMRALVASVLIVLFAALFFGWTYDAGQMAPNSDVVLTSGEWLDAVKYGCPGVQTDGCTMPLHLWEDGRAYQDYETFSAFGYGFDLFIPLDALGQEAAWAPSYGRGALGAVGYWLRWLVQVLGWVITAVAAATLAGLVGRRD